MLFVDLFPSLFNLLLFAKFVAVVFLGLLSDLFEALSVHVHVGADHTVGDSGHCLVPVLLLAVVHEALYDDGVCLGHIGLDYLLYRIRIQH